MTRDSILFSWLAVVVAIAGYLGLGDPPNQWDWAEWMQAVVSIGGILTAKLGSSPLKHSDESNKVLGR